MEPIFYDINTFEPLPPSGLVAQPLRPLQAPPPPTPSAAATGPTSPPLRVAAAKPLAPAGRYDRLVATPERIVAVGRENVLILDRDLTPVNHLPAPIGMRVDAPRDLIYMADVFGSVVARRTGDLSIALRLIPTFPRGYERHVLYVDASTLLLASVELKQMSHAIAHVPDITMFEWWDLGDPATASPSNFVPADAHVTAITYSRTRPLLFAASAATGDPLILAQPGHLLWLDRALQLTADVALPKEMMPRALAVDDRGAAMLVVRAGNADRFWSVDRTGQQLADVALAGQVFGAAELALHCVPGAGVYVIAGSTVVGIDQRGAERWRAQLASAPVLATVLENEGGLLAANGTRLLRIGAGGNVDVVYEANKALVSAPVRRGGEVLVTTSDEILALSPAQ